MNTFNIQLTKYTVVGAANFFLTFIIFSVMLKSLELDSLIALGFAWLCGVIFSYTANFFWVFKPKKEMQFKVRIARFLSTSLLSLGLNMFALSYLTEHSNLDPLYVQMLLIPLVVIFNFTMAKYWSML